jgi:hypothetical protein
MEMDLEVKVRRVEKEISNSEGHAATQFKLQEYFRDGGQRASRGNLAPNNIRNE